MSVSIVIPAKNEEKYLPKLLATLRRQCLRDFEIIVADAGSTDATRQIAESYGARVVEGGLPGPGRNRGAAAATGDHLIFFDADVLMPHDHYLAECLEEMDERGLDITTCPLRAHEADVLDHVMHGAYNVYSRATENVLPHGGGFCLFVRRTAHEAVRGFDEEVVFAEDHDYVRRIKKAGFRFGILRKNKILVSARRLHKEGRLNLAAKYAFSEIRILARGPFKREVPFRYEFGNFDGEDKE